MTCKPGRPSVEEQLREAEGVPVELYPEMIETLRSRDPGVYCALLAALCEDLD